MSTYKFHINDSKEGHDLESRTLMKMGFGDVLNKRNQTEKCIDTVSMYKKASSGETLGALAGGTVGAIGGAELAGAFTESATAKLLAALAGGVGGAYVGGRIGRGMDTAPITSDKHWGHNAKTNTALALGITGGAVGYGINKYLLENKGPASATIATLIGATAGGGLGYYLAENTSSKPNVINNYGVRNKLQDTFNLPNNDLQTFAKDTAYNRELLRLNNIPFHTDNKHRGDLIISTEALRGAGHFGTGLQIPVPEEKQ